MNTYRKKDRSLQDFTSCQMMICLKFCHKRKSQQQSSLTWRKCLRISTRLSSITRKLLWQCFQLKRKRWTLWKKWIPTKKMWKIGWIRSKIWCVKVSNINSKTQWISTQWPKEPIGLVTIQASAFLTALKFGGPPLFSKPLVRTVLPNISISPQTN